MLGTVFSIGFSSTCFTLVRTLFDFGFTGHFFVYTVDDKVSNFNRKIMGWFKKNKLGKLDREVLKH
jgi:hypothetical protein